MASSGLYGPPQSPVLRGLRTKMYDREQVGGNITKSMFFVDNRRTADGRSKDQSFTNMWQCGQLGFPIEYDLVTIGIYPVAGDEPYLSKYNRFVNSDAVFSWFFGQNYRVAETPVVLMKPSPVAATYVRDEVNGKSYQIVVRNGEISLTETGEGVVNLNREGIVRTVNMTTPERKARRISSVECFHGTIEGRHTVMGDEIDVYMAMDGIMWDAIR